MDVFIEGFFEEWHLFLKILPRIAFAAMILIVFIWIGRMTGRGLVVPDAVQRADGASSPTWAGSHFPGGLDELSHG